MDENELQAAVENETQQSQPDAAMPFNLPAESPVPFTPPQMPQVDPAAIQNTVQQATTAVQQGVQAGMNSNFTGGPLPTVEGNADLGENLQHLAEVGQETGTAVVGGLADASESVGRTLDLGGDTFNKVLNDIRGKPTSPDQDPFNEGYEYGTWLDIPDDWVPENKTGYGKIVRGLVEFGAIALTTKGIGKAAGIARAANVASKGNKWIQFSRIAAEGSVADFVASGGVKKGEAPTYEQNLVNLFRDNMPGMLPVLTKALAVNKGDNPWLMRLKTVLIGSGFNLLFHNIGGYLFGKRAAQQAKRQGLSEVEIDAAGNDAMEKFIKEQVALDEKTGLENAADNFAAGKGKSRSTKQTEYNYTHGTDDEVAELSDAATKAERRQQLQDIINERGAAAGDEWDSVHRTSPSQEAANINREPDPFVNPELFDNVDKGIYRPDADPKASARQHLLELVSDINKGGEGRAYTPYATETAIKAMSAGNKTYREWVKETLDDITDAAFRGMDNAMSWEEVQNAIIVKATPILENIHAYADGKKVDLLNLFKKQLDDPNNYRVYADEVLDDTGKFVKHKIKTITPVQKGVNIIGIQALTRLSSDIATGAVQISDGLSIGRQVDMLLEASKRAMIENKKLSLMWGLDGQAMKASFKLSTPLQRAYSAQLDELTKEMNEYFDWLHRLAKNGDHDTRTKIAALHQMSDGKVRSMDHVHQYLWARIRGGRMDNENIGGQLWEEAVGGFYNSILSAPITPSKAIISTNLFAISRPFVTALSANMPWRKNPKEALIAAAQIDAIGRSMGEALKAFKHNLDLGNARKNQTYTGKFDIIDTRDEYKNLAEYIETFGDSAQQLSYGLVDAWSNINHHPWVAYSRIWMGAGDAAARTISGRFRMASKTSRALLEQGVDPNDLNKFVREFEEGFRYGPEGVFKKDKYGFDVVNDKLATLAGDKAALTSDLEGHAKHLQDLQNVPFMRNFFSFMKPGINGLGRDFVENTPFARLQNRFKDLTANPPRNLEVYGLKPDEVEAEVLLMKGNIDVAKAIVAGTVVATLAGRYRGSMPLDREEREHWVQRDIMPNSVNIAGVQFALKRMEHFQPVMALTANAVSNAHVLGEDWTDRFLQKAVWMGATIIVDQSMLSGVEDLASILDPESANKKTAYTLTRIARSWLPAAGISGALGNILDSAKKEANTASEMIFRRDFWYKKNLANKYDVVGKDRSGKPLVYGPENTILKLFNAISPVAIVPIDNDPVKIMLQDMRYDLPSIMSKYNGVELNSLEKSAMSRAMSMDHTFRRQLERRANPNGPWMKSFNKYKEGGFKIYDNKFRQTMKGLFTDDEGKKKIAAKEGYPLNEQRTWYTDIDNVFTDAKERAMESVLKEYPDLRQRLKLRLGKKELGARGGYEGAETKLIPELMNIPK